MKLCRLPADGLWWYYANTVRKLAKFTRSSIVRFVHPDLTKQISVLSLNNIYTFCNYCYNRSLQNSESSKLCKGSKTLYGFMKLPVSLTGKSSLRILMVLIKLQLFLLFSLNCHSLECRTFFRALVEQLSRKITLCSLWMFWFSARFALTCFLYNLLFRSSRQLWVYNLCYQNTCPSGILKSRPKASNISVRLRLV